MLDDIIKKVSGVSFLNYYDSEGVSREKILDVFDGVYQDQINVGTLLLLLQYKAQVAVKIAFRNDSAALEWCTVVAATVALLVERETTETTETTASALLQANKLLYATHPMVSGTEAKSVAVEAVKHLVISLGLFCDLHTKF